MGRCCVNDCLVEGEDGVGVVEEVVWDFLQIRVESDAEKGFLSEDVVYKLFSIHCMFVVFYCWGIICFFCSRANVGRARVSGGVKAEWIFRNYQFVCRFPAYSVVAIISATFGGSMWLMGRPAFKRCLISLEL